jgi:hypothetical protein
MVRAMDHPKGGFLTPNLFLPPEVWQQSGARIVAYRLKVDRSGQLLRLLMELPATVQFYQDNTKAILNVRVRVLPPIYYSQPWLLLKLVYSRFASYPISLDSFLPHHLLLLLFVVFFFFIIFFIDFNS